MAAAAAVLMDERDLLIEPVMAECDPATQYMNFVEQLKLREITTNNRLEARVFGTSKATVELVWKLRSKQVAEAGRVRDTVQVRALAARKGEKFGHARAGYR